MQIVKVLFEVEADKRRDGQFVREASRAGEKTNRRRRFRDDAFVSDPMEGKEEPEEEEDVRKVLKDDVQDVSEWAGKIDRGGPLRPILREGRQRRPLR